MTVVWLVLHIVLHDWVREISKARPMYRCRLRTGSGQGEGREKWDVRNRKELAREISKAV